MTVARPPFQERMHDYVLGPNQDSRLASVAAGAIIKGIELQLDPDAPFQLRSRAVRQQYTSALTQNGLQFLASRWTGQRGKQDYRHTDYVPESLQMAYYGQMGSPKPIWRNLVYPANGLIVIDIKNAGASAITNLTFYWRGVKLFPWGSVQAYTYPKDFAAIQYNYQIPVATLGVNDLRQNSIFYVEQDDFCCKAATCTAPFLLGSGGGARQFSEVFIAWKDEQRKPFSNDFVALDVFFGAAGFPAMIPLGQTPAFIAPFGPGPCLPGLFYPEIYVPLNHQLFFDLKRTDGAANANQAESFTINLIGQKVYPR